MIRDPTDRLEAIENLTTQYVAGVISETVYAVSLGHHMDSSEVRYLLILNQPAHRQSLNYQRGLYR